MVSLNYLERIVKDALQAAGSDPEALPAEVPQCEISLPDAPPVFQALWNAALCDIESNLVETEDGSIFFGSSESEGMHLNSRDLSLAIILGLHRLYPEQAYSALRFAREARLSLGWTVCQSEVVGDIGAPWKTEDLDRQGFIDKYDTDSIIQNTDDVAWLWAAYELFTQGMDARREDWQWLYDQGIASFETLYSFLYDDVDEMYCGQAVGIAIHRPEQASDGYPPSWGVSECVHCHSTATNALYVKAFDVMAEAATHCGKADEAPAWRDMAAKLRASVRIDMSHEQGSLAYYRDRVGKLTGRRHALGEAFAVLHGVVEGKQADNLLSSFPYDKVGVPLLHPAFNNDEHLYNHSTWPYVSTFFFMAREKARGVQDVNANAVAVARNFVHGNFHERMNYRSGEALGSARHLCSAASWVNVCLRAGLVPQL